MTVREDGRASGLEENLGARLAELGDLVRAVAERLVRGLGAAAQRDHRALDHFLAPAARDDDLAPAGLDQVRAVLARRDREAAGRRRRGSGLLRLGDRDRA